MEQTIIIRLSCRGEWGEMGRHRQAPREINTDRQFQIFSGTYPYNVTLLIIYLTLFCCIIIRARLRSSNKSRVKVWRNGP